MSKNKIETLDEFSRGYFAASLWTFDDDAPGGDFEKSGRIEKLMPRIAPETFEKMLREADAFQGNFGFLWRESGQFAEIQRAALLTEAQAGHDFWITRNRRGGFLDRNIGEAGEKLTKAANDCGRRDLYIRDDGLICS